MKISTIGEAAALIGQRVHAIKPEGAVWAAALILEHVFGCDVTSE